MVVNLIRSGFVRFCVTLRLGQAVLEAGEIRCETAHSKLFPENDVIRDWDADRGGINRCLRRFKVAS